MTEFHNNWKDILLSMDAEPEFRCLRYIFDYQDNNIEPELNGLEYSIWAGIKRQIDDDRANKSEVRRKRVNGGRRGGRPKKSLSGEKNLLENENLEVNKNHEVNKNLKVNENLKVSEEREETSLMGSQGFLPPEPPNLPNSPLTLLEERELSPRACAREETDTDPEEVSSDSGLAGQDAPFRKEPDNPDSATEQNVPSADGTKKKDDSGNKTDSLFDTFWQEYPKKVAKKEARRVFARIHPDLELTQTMIRAVQAQSESRQWQDPKFIPNPTTWLNQERWNDELNPSPSDTGPPRAGPKMPEQDITLPSYDSDLFRKKAVAPVVYHPRGSPADEESGNPEGTQ